MKAATIFIQVALVAAGIFVYDQLRSDPPALGPDPELEARVPEARDPAPRDVQPIVLSGSGGEALIRRMSALEQRIDDLERARSSRTTAVRDTPGAGSDEPGYRPPRLGTEGDVGDTTFSEEDLLWFRNVKGEVERIERSERYATMVSRQLDRLGISLTDNQKNEVVKTTISFRDQVRTTVQKHQQKGTPNEDRQSELEKMRKDFDETVYRLVPAADAEKIVEVLGRYPGFGNRRPGKSGRFEPNR